MTKHSGEKNVYKMFTCAVCQILIVEFENDLGDFEDKACLLILDQVSACV